MEKKLVMQTLSIIHEICMKFVQFNRKKYISIRLHKKCGSWIEVDRNYGFYENVVGILISSLSGNYKRVLGQKSPHS